MFEVILPKFGVQTTYVDGRVTENFVKAIKKETTLIYLESPNSWDYALQDLEAIAALAREKGLVTMIDNSYCTPLYQQPARLGIDLCMQTATKYISGHSDTLGGVLSGSHAMMKKIFDSEYLNVGSGISPFNAWLLIRGLRTLPTRLAQITRTTEKVIAFLASHPKVERIIYPFHESFGQYGLARKQMKGACGLFTFTLKNGTVASITRFCESLRHFLMAVSWGGHESLVLPRCAGMKEKDFNASDPEHQYIRMYLGLEDADYLIADLNQALNGI
jgi:cystathionine beta-lyase/cystathionine gamma-synthase